MDNNNGELFFSNENISKDTSIIDTILEMSKKELRLFYTVSNLYSDPYSLLVKEVTSFVYDDLLYVRLRFQHYRRRNIERIKITLFADHGKKQLLSDNGNPQAYQENNPHVYNKIYRAGNYYNFIADISNCKEDNIIDFVGIPISETVSLSFSCLSIHEASHINPNFFQSIYTFKEITEIEKRALENSLLSTHTVKRANDLAGTSNEEQMIFYFIHLAFKDALNRCKLRINDNEYYETDIFIPSIKVAIEYDGKPWHENSKRLSYDNQKNKRLNDIGISVFRVREIGLPKLNDFNGLTFVHGKPPQGLHMTSVIEEIMHALSTYVTYPVFKQELQQFTLSYEDYLIFRPRIEASLFPTKKSPNFTECYEYQYWCKGMNTPLKPENIDEKSNVFAWFKCPKGKYIIRVVQSLYCARLKITPQLNSIYSICPFMPHDSILAHGVDCGENCDYVEPRLTDLLFSYLHGVPGYSEIDQTTKYWVRYYPRVCFSVIKESLTADSKVKKRFETAFIDTNIFNNKRTLVMRYIQLDYPYEIKYVKEFYKLYPDLLINFNWELFDNNDTNRKLLVATLEYLLSTISTFYVKIQHLFSERKKPMSKRLYNSLKNMKHLSSVDFQFIEREISFE